MLESNFMLLLKNNVGASEKTKLVTQSNFLLAFLTDTRPMAAEMI